MGQFKPMTKMETTEPSVILKLKTGGHVNMKKGGSASCGHKAMGKADGGIMGALTETPSLVGRPAMAAPVQKIGKPSMSARRKAMMAKPAAAPAGMPAMKKGGKMATGGVVSGNGGGYKTGGVADSNGGGYKKGGKTSKKAYAAGGTVNSGKPVAMPQGNKKPQPPVSISKLAGTYKKGGRATPAERREESAFNSENATAMRQSKADSNLKYAKGGRASMEVPFGTFEDEDSGSAGMGNNGLRSDAKEGALKSTPKAVISERKKVTVVPREAKVTTGAGGFGVTGTPEEIERALSKVDDRGYPLKP